MQSRCVPACPDIYLEMQTRALSMPVKATGKFQLNLTHDLVVKTKAQNSYKRHWIPENHEQGHQHREGYRRAQRGVQEGSGGLHGSAMAWRILLDQITSLHCASVSISALRQAMGNTFYSLFWDLQVALYHNVAESMWAYHSFQLQTIYNWYC